MLISVILPTLLATAVGALAQVGNVVDAVNLSAVIDRLREEAGIRGASVGVVYNGHSWAQGFGLKTINGTDKIDAGTLFMIGSLTKSFTSVGLSQIVSQGKHRWDQPVMPTLARLWDNPPAFYDPGTNANVTLLDILSHQTGLARHDFIFDPALTRHPQEVLDRLKYYAPAAPLRDGSLHYSNQAYILAGELLGKLSESSWGDYIARHILHPLRMKDTVTDYANYASTPNRSDGKSSETDAADVFIDVAGGAGVISSTADDMLKYVRELLKTLRRGSRGFGLSRRTLREFRHPHVKRASAPGRNEFLNVTDPGYALGLMTGQWNSEPYYGHSGATNGFYSQMCMLPNSDLGVVVLTNSGPNPCFLERVCTYVFESVLTPKSPPASSYTCKSDSPPPTQAPLPRPTFPARLPMSAYQGTYHSPGYGNLTLALPKGSDTLLLSVGQYHPRLETSVTPIGPDTFFVALTGLNATVAMKDNDEVLGIHLQMDGEMLKDCRDPFYGMGCAEWFAKVATHT
ncbi:beta-lactamase/transpeptidase-like protein [Powellomyces hirtus]|nr:beta-lactamase/transpeptidase-like protein [Powellomyces hirtus]